MNPGREFINANRDQFIELGRLIRQIDSINGIERLQDIKGRQMAIRIIKEWISTLWGAELEDIIPDEDDDLFRTIKS